MLILDGKQTAARLRRELAAKIALARDMGFRPPGLAVILVGDNPASQVYVRNKQRACAECGIESYPHFLPAQISTEELLSLIAELNFRPEVDGILLQLPVPKHIDTDKCLLAIEQDKDVDGFNPANIGRLALGLPCFAPCTPAGVLYLLSQYGFSLAGKKAVIVGRSDIVGKPLALMLLQKNINATVTICHSATADLKSECQQADFLFAAMGKANAITGDMIKPGCVIVDIGINRGANGLCGDVDFASVSEKAAAVSPVPGGVGPMTIAMLMYNAYKSWKERVGFSLPGDNTEN